MEQLFSKKRKNNNHEHELVEKKLKCEEAACDYKANTRKNPIVLKEKRGLVTKLVNESYGVATVNLVDFGCVGVIFDTCEFWNNGVTLDQKGLSLPNVIQVGDWINLNAVKILEGGSDERNVLYLATAAMKPGQFWNLPVKHLSDIPKEKKETFYAVLSYLSSSPISISEREMLNKSKAMMVTNVKSTADKVDWTAKTPQNSASKKSPYNWFGLQCTSTEPPPQLCTSSKAPSEIQSIQQWINRNSVPKCTSATPLQLFNSKKSFQPSFSPKSSESPQENSSSTPSVVLSVEGFPPGFGLLEGNLVKVFAVTDFLDCLLCLQTLSMKSHHKFIPFYQTHFKSAEHKQKVANSKSHKNLIKQYIGQRTLGKAVIPQAKAKFGLESLYCYGDLEMYKCNYCPKEGVTMWHFLQLKNSIQHNQDFRPHCQNFLDGICSRPVCQFKHYSKEFVLDGRKDPGFLPPDILRITSSELNAHPVSILRQRQTNIGLELPIFKKNNEVDAKGFTRRFCHVSLCLSKVNEDERRIFFGKGSTNREAKEDAAIAALAALKVRRPTDPCPHGNSQQVGCWCLGAKSVFQH